MAECAMDWENFEWWRWDEGGRYDCRCGDGGVEDRCCMGWIGWIGDVGFDIGSVEDCNVFFDIFRPKVNKSLILEEENKKMK